MVKAKEKSLIAKALLSIAEKSLSASANSRCMLIYHQPKQPEAVKKFRKF